MNIQFPIDFTKMSGTGNDFILIDHRTPFLSREEMPAFARAVCERRISVGADGLIFIEHSEAADFRWQFLNADGSWAEMCGNGARCAARFAHARGIAPARMRFETVAGLIEAEVTGQSVKLKMTAPTGLRLQEKLTVNGQEQVVHSLNTGVPHAVLFMEDIRQAPVLEWGRAIRFHEHFQPAGTNVNFVQQQRRQRTDRPHLRTRSRRGNPGLRHRGRGLGHHRRTSRPGAAAGGGDHLGRRAADHPLLPCRAGDCRRLSGRTGQFYLRRSAARRSTTNEIVRDYPLFCL